MSNIFRTTLFALCLVWGVTTHAATEVNQPAPKIDTELIGGKLLQAKELEGRPVMVFFWATWCTTCAREMPELQRLYDTYKGRGLEMLAVSLDEDPNMVAEFWKEKGYTFPVAMRTPALKKAWGSVPATPQMILVDRKGIVRVKIRGALSYAEREDLIKPLL
jgi:peroxiredoxin